MHRDLASDDRLIVDVLVNKAAAIARAVRRVREEHAGDDRNLLENQTRQGVPQETREKLNFDTVRSIVAERLDDLLDFARILLRS